MKTLNDTSQLWLSPPPTLATPGCPALCSQSPDKPHHPATALAHNPAWVPDRPHAHWLLRHIRRKDDEWCLLGFIQSVLPIKEKCHLCLKPSEAHLFSYLWEYVGHALPFSLFTFKSTPHLVSLLPQVTSHSSPYSQYFLLKYGWKAKGAVIFGTL